MSCRKTAASEVSRLAGTSLVVALVALAVAGTVTAVAQTPTSPARELREQRFDSDPGWEASHNRLVAAPCPITDQSFGYRASTFAGLAAGEIGGKVWNSLTPASYGKRLPGTLSLENSLSASGTLNIRSGSSFASGKGLQAGGALFGFYNSASSKDWRLADSLTFRLEEGDGQNNFVVGPEYGTHDYRAGGARIMDPAGAGGRAHLAVATTYRWNLQYDPAAAGGRGEMRLTVDGIGTSTLPLEEGHKSAGASFDRFGLINRQIGGNEIRVFYDDLVINGVSEPLTAAPADWEGRGNSQSFSDCAIDDRHDFGWSGTDIGGASGGKMGGLLWRTEANQPELAAYYGDRVGALTLSEELNARGKVRLDQASSDSGINVGFFNAGRQGRDQGQGVPQEFLGFSTDAPSRIGFVFQTIYRAAGGGAVGASGPTIIPDGGVRDWTLHYLPDPDPNGGGRITATLGSESRTVLVSPEDRRRGATFDHFGLVNVPIGGHSQTIWFDDLAYTAEARAVSVPPPAPAPVSEPAPSSSGGSSSGPDSGASEPTSPAPAPVAPAPPSLPAVSRIAVEGVPTRCVRKGFSFTVRMAPPLRPEGARVRLDGRTVRVSSLGAFRVRIPAGRLRPGAHRLSVSQPNDPSASLTRRFRRCR